MRLTGKHFGNGWRDVNIRQTLIATGMEEPEHCAVMQRDPDAQTARVRHAGDGTARVATHGEHVLDVQCMSVEDLHTVVATAPEFTRD